MQGAYARSLSRGLLGSLVSDSLPPDGESGYCSFIIAELCEYLVGVFTNCRDRGHGLLYATASQGFDREATTSVLRRSFGAVGIHVTPGPAVVDTRFRPLPPLLMIETLGDLPDDYSASRRLMSPLEACTERFKVTSESS